MNEIILKNADEIELMQYSGQLLAQVFETLDSYMKPDLSAMEINNCVESYIVNTLSARPASKGQYGFQFVLNSSINEVVCHGVPSVGKYIKNGDIINIDIILEKNGFIADSSKMYQIGEIKPIAKTLIDVSYQSMWKGIQQVRPGATTGDIGYAIQQHAQKYGWTVITKDKKLSAQWEHTIAVTASGFKVLTLRKEEIPFISLYTQSV